MGEPVLSDEQIDEVSYRLWGEATQRVMVLAHREFARAILAAAEPAIRAEERERCAKVCDTTYFARWDAQLPREASTARALAIAIRQLGAGSKGDAS